MAKDQAMDDRFAHVSSDPRFRTLRKSDKKVKIDKRFDRMFTEKRFKLKYSVDKRGKQTKSGEDYKNLYEVSAEEEVVKEGDDDDDDKKPEDDVEVAAKVPKKPLFMNARGLDSDEDSEDVSSSSESEESSGDEGEEIDHKWNEWDKDVPQTEAATKRLAICNIDWERINATDLFVLINSFKPSGGSVLSVKIYPSELGLQRMKAEAESGPIQFIKAAKRDKRDANDSADDTDDDELDEDVKDSRITEQLRQYEMTRLQYFYAVVECDSEATADVLYGELDGFEYESSSSTLDLRFIPEDMTFDAELTPKSECHSMPDLSAYKAPQFVNSALQQSKVRMTWDETDPKRRHVFEKAFKEEDDDDLKAYLATSSEEEDDGEAVQTPDFADDPTLGTKDKINKYKELLSSLSEPKESKSDEKDMEMEISWEPNLKDVVEDIVEKKEKQRDSSLFYQTLSNIKEKRKQKSKQLAEEEKEEEEDDEELDSEESSDEKITTKTKRKPKHKKNDKKNEKLDPELELLLMDSDENSDKKHFNYKNIVENQTNDKKRKHETTDSFKFNAEDPRFGAVYTSHHYNVDPSDPHFKRTEAFDEIMSHSKKSRKSDETQTNSKTNADNNDSSKSSLTQLVRTVKNKTQLINNKKHKKSQIKQNKFKS
ncbi:unnamed protein product [Oppiella nova]|uniref:NUC153 domain-containing protein n=1 Tax=Oppiella nova TaxID=334625 RepID=A0A7R9LRB1_9ACAR|nr:unnamed protein product [Oppiella nova]CAG2165453.1 unnamed protein product [Oppiella nova]